MKLSNDNEKGLEKSKVFQKIILATTSPYRIDAMKFTGIPFEAVGSDVEEKFEGRPDKPEELVKQLSKLKAEAVAKNFDDALVIGFDSVAYFEGRILEKPKSYEEAFSRLKMLSGNSHEFYTGITLINAKTNKIIQETVKTKIDFRNLSEEEIEKYIEEDKFHNKYASGYDPLANRSATFIKKFEGDPHNILRGIPLATVIKMIEEAKK